MDPTQFQVVGSPNYAGPIVNWFGNQSQPNQNQQNQKNQQQQNQQPDWVSRLRAWLQQQQQQPAQMGPQASTQPGAPLDLTPGTVAGANQLTAGLY